MQELTNAGGVNATYTTENDSYYGTLLHLKRATGETRFPLYDEIGSARGLVDASATVTDTYDTDTFGRPIGTTGSTPNPYRYGAAWGYITDPSGFLQLGARYYWPEVGRFVQRDADRDPSVNPLIGAGLRRDLTRHRVTCSRTATPSRGWDYAAANPVRYVDPTGWIPQGAARCTDGTPEGCCEVLYEVTGSRDCEKECLERVGQDPVGKKKPTANELICNWKKCEQDKLKRLPWRVAWAFVKATFGFGHGLTGPPGKGGRACQG